MLRPGERISDPGKPGDARSCACPFLVAAHFSVRQAKSVQWRRIYCQDCVQIRLRLLFRKSVRLLVRMTTHREKACPDRRWVDINLSRKSPPTDSEYIS